MIEVIISMPKPKVPSLNIWLMISKAGLIVTRTSTAKAIIKKIMTIDIADAIIAGITSRSVSHAGGSIKTGLGFLTLIFFSLT